MLQDVKVKGKKQEYCFNGVSEVEKNINKQENTLKDKS